MGVVVEFVGDFFGMEPWAGDLVHHGSVLDDGEVEGFAVEGY